MNNNFGTTPQNLEVCNKVRTIIADKFGIDYKRIGMSSRLDKDLGADSLDVVELIMEFEKEFGIVIPDSDAESVRTVGDICNYLASHVGFDAKEETSYGTSLSSSTSIGTSTPLSRPSSFSTGSSTTTSESSLFKDWLNKRR